MLRVILLVLWQNATDAEGVELFATSDGDPLTEDIGSIAAQYGWPGLAERGAHQCRSLGKLGGQFANDSEAPSSLWHG